MKKTKLTTLITLLLIMTITACKDQPKNRVQKNQIIACLGDSVTYSGNHGYAEYLQKYVNKNHQDLNLTFLNWGKNSETITHLTEEGHPGPRPFLFDRLDKLLSDQPKPDIIAFCYGINCGIYGKPSSQLFDTYKKGLNRFLDRMEKEQIKVILMTPPPLALEVAKANGHKNLAPVNGKYTWKQPYENYDAEVLKEFSNIVLTTKHPVIIDKVDIREPLLKSMETSYGGDPIHPNTKGNEVIAKALIKELF